MQGQQRVKIVEHKVSKFIERFGCYEVMSNDNTMKIVLRNVSVMDDSMERAFFSTTTWIKEDNGWVKCNDTQNFPSREAFIEALKASEDFTQAIRDYEEYKFNI